MDETSSVKKAACVLRDAFKEYLDAKEMRESLPRNIEEALADWLVDTAEADLRFDETYQALVDAEMAYLNALCESAE